MEVQYSGETILLLVQKILKLFGGLSVCLGSWWNKTKQLVQIRNCFVLLLSLTVMLRLRSHRISPSSFCGALSRCESLALYRIMYGNRATEVQRGNNFVVGSDNTEIVWRS